MTCCLGFAKDGEVWLASDSGGSSGEYCRAWKHGKAFAFGPADGRMLAAYTTSFRFGQLLRSLRVPPRPDEVDPEEYLVETFVDALAERLREKSALARKDEVVEGGHFLVGMRHGRLFEVSPNFGVLEPELPFAAVGSGHAVALGALHATDHLPFPSASPERAWVALRAAAALCADVRPPFHALRLDHLGKVHRWTTTIDGSVASAAQDWERRP